MKVASSSVGRPAVNLISTILCLRILFLLQNQRSGFMRLRSRHLEATALASGFSPRSQEGRIHSKSKAVRNLKYSLTSAQLLALTVRPPCQRTPIVCENSCGSAMFSLTLVSDHWARRLFRLASVG